MRARVLTLDGLAKIMDGLFPSGAPKIASRIFLMSNLSSAEEPFQLGVSALLNMDIRHERLPRPLSGASGKCGRILFARAPVTFH